MGILMFAKIRSGFLDYLEDPKWYRPTQIGLLFITAALPILSVFLFPTFFWIALLGSIALAIDLLNDYEAELRFVEMARQEPMPTRPAAIVRLRLAAFGALTLLPLGLALAWTIGRNPFDLRGVAVLASLCLLGVILSPTSKTVVMWMISGWRLISDIPLGLASIWITLTKSGESARRARQRLYDVENSFFVWVAGYQTSSTFRGDSGWLKENIP